MTKSRTIMRIPSIFRIAFFAMGALAACTLHSQQESDEDSSRATTAISAAASTGMPGTDVGCGPGNAGCWMISTECGYSGGCLIYKQDTAGNWVHMPGAAVAIDVGGRGVWAVNDGGFIFRWNGLNWIQSSYGGATDIGVGGGQERDGGPDGGGGWDGEVWIVGTTKIGTDYEVWHWNTTTSQWDKYPGGGVRIDVDPQGRPWLVNYAGQVWHWNGSSWDELTYGVRADDVGVSADGSVFIVTRDAGQIAKWTGSGWTSVPGAAGLRVTGRADGTPMFVPVR